jgi:Mn-dependent DtxR family transcriptional regulator
MKILDYLVQTEEGVSSNSIASQNKVDPALVSRMLRYLAAHGYIEEVDVDLFKANKSTKALMMPKSVAGFRFAYVIKIC